jgi:short-subunit dehydrogenase
MGIGTNRPFAVITGASSGIGFELAKQCIQHDFDALICAEDDGIHDAAQHLGAAGASVEAVCADLATYEGVEALYRAINQSMRPVDALLLNAGVGVAGAFLLTDLEEELRMIALNVTSIVHLAKRVIPRMVNRGSGRVLITSSIAATAPAPYLAVYGATKAFDLSFSEALRNELADTGVTVTALQPGATDTEFFDRADMDTTKLAQDRKADPEEVAREGFLAMMEGKDKVIAASSVQAMATKPGSGKKR